jgi:hypothetical protein
VEEMATLAETAYGALLSQVRPRVVKTEAENERAIAELEALDTLGRPLTREEAALADLLTTNPLARMIPAADTALICSRQLRFGPAGPAFTPINVRMARHPGIETETP